MYIFSKQEENSNIFGRRESNLIPPSDYLGTKILFKQVSNALRHKY